MSLFKLSKAARSDLKNIAAYTQKNWGAQQRRTYLAKLDKAFHFLADNPLAGMPCPYIEEGLRKHRTENHIIFYDIADKQVFIIRILHVSMDIEEYF